MIPRVSVLFILLFNFQISTLSLSPDGLSLLSLKSAVDSSSAFSDWNEEEDTPCKWTGVSCMNVSGSPDTRVVGLSLAGKNLRGYIPSELSTLVHLRRINLNDNNFHGPIPVQLLNATSLHSIFLNGNNLSGPLPPSFCSIFGLQNLDLSSNHLSGLIPTDFRNCKQLQRLILARNQFSGPIPPGIWPAMESLVQLDLSANYFDGEIPEDFGDLKSLSGTLNLSFNQFSGTIPDSLGKLPLAVSFDLRGNNLSGEIPQTGTFSNQGPTAFLNNPSLCGFPLQKKCANSAQDTPPGSRHLRTSSDGPKKGLKPSLIVLISAVDAAAIAFIGLIVVYVYWKKNDSGWCHCNRKKKVGEGSEMRHMCLCICLNDGGASERESDKEGDGFERGEGELVAIDKGFTFELDELLRASAYVLGKSGLGIVYKVILANGAPVVVRRLGEGGEQRYKEFVTEVQAIARVKHPNIVRLRAYYWAREEKLLVSDYISNGSLASARCGKTSKPLSSFPWSVRLKIGKGTAKGLAYLHECSPRKFVHGDIKPSNILLSHDFQAHISDFGLNRLISITGNNPGSSGGFIGAALPYLKTLQADKPNNYRAPESQVFGSKATEKWDVYSFGIILLELLTGRSPDHFPTTSTSTEITDLARWVRKGFEEENALSDMADPMLLQEMHARKEVLTVFKIALSCTEPDPGVRPRLKTVSHSLDRIGN